MLLFAPGVRGEPPHLHVYQQQLWPYVLEAGALPQAVQPGRECCSGLLLALPGVVSQGVRHDALDADGGWGAARRLRLDGDSLTAESVTVDGAPADWRMDGPDLIVTLPGPDEDHNPETGARLSDVLRANPAIPYEQRIQTARFIEDLTAGYQGGWYSVISLHGGGSPAAMKQEIWRNYPVGSKVELVERLLDRGVLHARNPVPAAEAMGLMVRPMAHLNVMSPPLTITESEVEFIATTLEKAIRQVTDELVREGHRLG